jgi:ring-1,2-phenylacetyl-CoA epoxidase subunit PaaE
MSIHFHPLKVSEVKRETPDSVSVAFDIPTELADTFRFTQGQNITVRTTLDGEEVRRNYSICSSPYDNELRIAVKQVPAGRFSTFANQTLKKGDELEVLPPTGKFYTILDPLAKKNYVAFAAGSGITPILSIIKTTLKTEIGSTFLLVYGNKQRKSILFLEELEALKNIYLDRFQIIHILSRERTESVLHAGRIDAEKCVMISDKIVHISTIDEFFICGPAAMIDTVKEFLSGKGIDRKKIHVELFNAPQQKIINDNKKLSETKQYENARAKVSIQIDGIVSQFELDFNGETILNAAMKQGIDLPFACKGGMCCTCRAKLESGEVDMDHNYALEQEEVEAGFILTCQSHPRGETLFVNFDTR